MSLPNFFQDVAHLEQVMSAPSEELSKELSELEGDILILGVGGKMGPTLARMAKLAAPQKRVIGVARFSEPGLQARLSAYGIECISCDLLSREALAALPEVANVVFMAGRKFGSQGSEWLTWAMNTHLPALVAERYKSSRIVAFSTACVYPFVSVQGPGAHESLAPTPVGEYANSCVGRERMFEHFSHQYQTPGRLIRLSYAIDMRYGVLHDLAQLIYANQPVSLAMGHANVIWQGEANERSLRALTKCTTPTTGLNLSGPMISIADAARGLASRLGKDLTFIGVEAPTAWLVDCTEANAYWGTPEVNLERMLDWTADWVLKGQASLNKPTHFEVRDGQY